MRQSNDPQHLPSQNNNDNEVLTCFDHGNWGKYFQANIHGYESKPWYLVNPKIAGKWMFIPLKMYLYVLTHTHIFIHILITRIKDVVFR